MRFIYICRSGGMYLLLSGHTGFRVHLQLKILPAVYVFSAQAGLNVYAETISETIFEHQNCTISAPTVEMTHLVNTCQAPNSPRSAHTKGPAQISVPALPFLQIIVSFSFVRMSQRTCPRDSPKPVTHSPMLTLHQPVRTELHILSGRRCCR